MNIDSIFVFAEKAVIRRIYISLSEFYENESSSHNAYTKFVASKAKESFWSDKDSPRPSNYSWYFLKVISDHLIDWDNIKIKAVSGKKYKVFKI